MPPAEAGRRCAAAVLAAYDALPARGKPQPLREWTVLAGVTATLADAAAGAGARHRALCLATGSKCISPLEQRERAPGAAAGGGASAGERGLLLNDAHAEVLCVRALRALLAREADAHVTAGCRLRGDGVGVGGVGEPAPCRLLEAWERGGRREDGAWPLLEHASASPPAATSLPSPPSPSSSSSSSSSPSSSSSSSSPSSPADAPAFPAVFRLRRGAALHFYISDSPCGAAALYADALPAATADGTAAAGGAGACAPAPAFARATGAKALPRAGSDVGASAIDGLRTKPGRSDLPKARRTTSHACSDKAMRWLALGLQGALLAHVFAGPLMPATLSVSAEQSADCLAGPSTTTELDGAAQGGGAQLLALRRALLERCGAERAAAEAAFGGVAPAPGEPELSVVSTRFPGGRAEATLRAAAAAAAGAGAAGLANRGQKRSRDVSERPEGGVDTGGGGGGGGRSDEASRSGSQGALDGAAAPLLLSRAVRERVVGGSGSGALVVPCPLSLIAISSEAGAGGTWSVEVVAGTAGVLHGATRAAPAERRASRFCKARLGRDFAQLWSRYCSAIGGDGPAAEGSVAVAHDSYASAKRCSAHAGCAHFNRARAAFHGGSNNASGAEGVASSSSSSSPTLASGWLFGAPDLEEFAFED